MVYLTLSALKAYLGTTQTADDDLLQNALDAAQQEIDSYCGRSFEGSTGIRYYRADDVQHLRHITGGTGTVLLLRKDFLALGGITNGDGTTIASTDCWLEPRNNPPYQYLRLKTNESWAWDTDGEITVSGTWGYSTSAPADVVEAVRETAAYLYKLKDSSVYDVVASPETGTITIPKGTPAHARKILNDGGYVRRRVIT